MESEVAGRRFRLPDPTFSKPGLSAFPVPDPSGTGTSREWFPYAMVASFRVAL
jgi:hypothetical protein